MINKFVINFFLLIFSFPLLGSERDSLVYSLNNPFQTVYTHLNNLQDNNFHPELAARSFLQPEVNIDKARNAAIKLKRILDGEGIYIDMDELPRDPEYLDSATNKHRYILTDKHPEIYLVKRGDNWIYSKTSINHVNQLFKEVFPLGTDKLLDILPKMGSTKYLGLYIWQFLGVLIIILFAFIVHKIFTLIIENIIIRLLERYGYGKIAADLIRPIAKPISYLIIFPILMILVPVLQLPITFSQYLIIGLKAIWPSVQ